jgi:hypothetical protein
VTFSAVQHYELKFRLLPIKTIIDIERSYDNGLNTVVEVAARYSTIELSWLSMILYVCWKIRIMHAEL